jgi:hypothetical protein
MRGWGLASGPWDRPLIRCPSGSIVVDRGRSYSFFDPCPPKPWRRRVAPRAPGLAAEIPRDSRQSFGDAWNPRLFRSKENMQLCAVVKVGLGVFLGASCPPKPWRRRMVVKQQIGPTRFRWKPDRQNHSTLKPKMDPFKPIQGNSKLQIGSKNRRPNWNFPAPASRLAPRAPGRFPIRSKKSMQPCVSA